MQDVTPVSFMGTAIVPAVLISACALLLLSFNNRIVAVLTRQRALHRELLEGSRKARAAASNAALSHLASAVWPNVPDASMAGSRSSSHRDLAAKEDQIAAEERYASSEWATAIERQIRDLRREAVLIRAAVSCLLAAILLFLISGVVLAASQLFPRAELPAIIIFLTALLAFAAGVLLMLSESFLIILPLTTEEQHLRRIISCASVAAPPPAALHHLTVLAR